MYPIHLLVQEPLATPRRLLFLHVCLLVLHVSMSSVSICWIDIFLCHDGPPIMKMYPFVSLGNTPNQHLISFDLPVR